MSLRPAFLNDLRRIGGFFFLSNICRFAVLGSDRLRYLNGQVSNDLQKCKPGCAMQACVLSAKGKLDAVVQIWEEADRFIIEADAAVATSLGERLKRYIVADDVYIEEITVYPAMHVFGPLQSEVSTTSPSLKIERLAAPGVDVPGIWQHSAHWPYASPAELAVLEIERLVPRWGLELEPDVLPAEVGLDKTAIDFSKGCYLGQEVISRIKSVGHVNRLLCRIIARSGVALKSGMPLFIESNPDKPVGKITRAAFHLDSINYVGLAIIKNSALSDRSLHVKLPSTHIIPIEIWDPAQWPR